MPASVAAWLAAAIAIGLAFRHHQKRSGGGAAAGLVALLVLASGWWVELSTDPPAPALWGATACVTAALFLVFAREPRPGGLAPESYPDTESLAAPTLASLLVLVSVWWAPPTVVLLAPIVASAPRGRRGRVLALAVVGVFAVAAVAVALSEGGPAWPTAASVLHRFGPELLGWNLVYLFGGRNFGLLVWYLPALLLVVCFRPGTHRGWLLAAAAVGTLALPLVSPHDFIGGSGAVANRAFLPFYAALWFVPPRAPRPLWLVAAAIGAGLFLWPAWRAPLATAAGDDRPAWHDRSLASRLPYETTQRHAPAFAEWQGTGVLSRSLTPALEDGDEGAVFAAASGPAQLMIAAERPLESVLIDFGPRAASELVVTGGSAGNTVFRPDGGIRFEVNLGPPVRSHPLWTGDRRYRVYVFEIEMPNAPERPLPVAIMARPADALPRSLDPARPGGER